MNKQTNWSHNEETGQSTCSKLCSITKKIYSVTIDTTQWHKWHYGREFIQNVMPELPIADREFLISGTTPKEWDSLFPVEEE